MSKTILFFSAFSGIFYHLPESDVKLMGLGQLPLKKQPKNNCKKCSARGFTGRDTNTLFYLTCTCVQKELNLELLKEIEDKHIPKQLPGQQPLASTN
jgi:hypothetical protein